MIFSTQKSILEDVNIDKEVFPFDVNITLFGFKTKLHYFNQLIHRTSIHYKLVKEKIKSKKEEEEIRAMLIY